MNPKLLATRGAWICAALVGLLVLGGWYNRGVEPVMLLHFASDCIYREGGCSTAFATWTLVLVTALAFLAASIAALYTRQLVDLEYQRVASIYSCREPIAHESHVPVTDLWISRNLTIHPGLPSDKPQYLGFLFEARNLGRSPLLGFRVKSSFEAGELCSKEPLELILGDIAAGEAIHFAIWIDTTVSFSNSGMTFAHGTSERGDVILPKRPQRLTLSVTTRTTPKS